MPSIETPSGSLSTISIRASMTALLGACDSFRHTLALVAVARQTIAPWNSGAFWDYCATKVNTQQNCVPTESRRRPVSDAPSNLPRVSENSQANAKLQSVDAICPVATLGGA